MSEEPLSYSSSGSKSDRKSFGIRLSPSLVKSLKILAVKMDKPVNRVLEMAILEFLAKHNEPVQRDSQDAEKS